MSTPIIDPSTLTEEQRKKIKELYDKTESDYCHVDEYNDWVVSDMLERFEEIFGKEFFEKRE